MNEEKFCSIRSEILDNKIYPISGDDLDYLFGEYRKNTHSTDEMVKLCERCVGPEYAGNLFNDLSRLHECLSE